MCVCIDIDMLDISWWIIQSALYILFTGHNSSIKEVLLFPVLQIRDPQHRKHLSNTKTKLCLCHIDLTVQVSKLNLFCLTPEVLITA